MGLADIARGRTKGQSFGMNPAFSNTGGPGNLASVERAGEGKVDVSPVARGGQSNGEPTKLPVLPPAEIVSDSSAPHADGN